MKRLEVKVFGDVQGVAFRAFAAREARARDITGEVSNFPDGTVLIVAEGGPHELEAFTLVLKSGPRFARVEKVEEQWTEATGAFPDFRIL